MLDDWDVFNANWLLYVSSLPYRAMAEQLVERFPYLAGDCSPKIILNSQEER